MSRPVDDNLEFSPRDVVFMGWVGDEDPTYKGLETALQYMLESGRRGYVGFGSDIGGYRSGSGPLGRTKELFLRWTAVGAMSSFMENGGGGEHLPWKFDNETTDIYRSWVNEHYRIVPYLYSEGTKVALGHNGSLMQPCDDIPAIGSRSYFLGPNIFVVPLVEDPAPGLRKRVWLPRSSTKQWINFFNTSIVHKSDSYVEEDASRLDRIPIYMEHNSLIPMYDLEKSESLTAFRFVLWGDAIVNEKETTLFTRDGQRWLLKFDRAQQQLQVHFVEQYDATQHENWIWTFCQYVHGRELCSKQWLKLNDKALIRLESMI